MSKRSFVGVLGAFSCVAAIALGGCAVQSGAEPQADEDSKEAMGAISATKVSFVTLRLDARKCVAPLCGGYFLHDVNSSSKTETYVSGLDFSLSGLSASDVANVTGAPAGELVLRGKLGTAEPAHKTRALLVTEAYRGMPGVVAVDSDVFYTTQQTSIECFAAPCMNIHASKVNSIVTKDFSNLDVAGASHAFVDPQWLGGRALGHGAIVVGHFHNGSHLTAGYERVLAASQIFIRLPDMKGPCPAIKLPACPSGTVRTYVHDANRCDMPTDCVKPGICPMYLPYCGEDYTLSSTPSMPNACPKFACEPSFVVN